MDERLRQDLANWLEFYRELGIEEFYRRDPGALANTRTVPPPTAHLVAARNDMPVPMHAGMPIPRAATPPAAAEPTPVLPAAPPPRVEVPPTVAAAAPIRPPVASFSLFETPAPKPTGPETLQEIRADLGDCRRCKLSGGRKTIVFGEGNPHAELVFVGEGPGADEDEQGLPFVGRAGQLLNRMIQMIDMKRQEVYICNVVKCRPPGNRTPEKDEIETCSPFLFRQLETIQPRLICCLGAPAVKTVLGIKEGITKIHGQFYDFAHSKALATVHPAYVLRNPREEKILREDFEKIREFLKRK
jgi:uracil-DNA glycosylase